MLRHGARVGARESRADGSVQVALLAVCTSQWKYISPLPALLHLKPVAEWPMRWPMAEPAAHHVPIRPPPVPTRYASVAHNNAFVQACKKYFPCASVFVASSQASTSEFHPSSKLIRPAVLSITYPSLARFLAPHFLNNGEPIRGRR